MGRRQLQNLTGREGPGRTRESATKGSSRAPMMMMMMMMMRMIAAMFT